jgi:hypothetical protein
MFFDYCKTAYRSFLEGKDEYNDLDANLEKSFDEKNRTAKEDSVRFQKENSKLLAEIQVSFNRFSAGVIWLAFCRNSSSPRRTLVSWSRRTTTSPLTVSYGAHMYTHKHAIYVCSCQV